tara:strand:- start:460 stop:1188 length:729 start_codon:yes stop_codon:yes gene_type:complete
MTYDALNDRKNAKKFLQEAIENYPSASYVHGMKIRWNFEDNKETREAKIAIENAIISTDIGAIMDIILQVYIFEKDYKTPLDLLKNLERNIFTHQSSLNAKDYYIGMLYDLMGENKLAISYYKSALSILEKKLNENIGDAMLHAAISRVYIRLGLIEEAVKSAQLSVALVSPARDAWYGVINKTNLAYIYESSNLIDDALHTLSEVYNKPFGPKKAELLLYWEWENLRTNSRFQSMINNNNI